MAAPECELEDLVLRIRPAGPLVCDHEVISLRDQGKLVFAAETE